MREADHREDVSMQVVHEKVLKRVQSVFRLTALIIAGVTVVLKVREEMEGRQIDPRLQVKPLLQGRVLKNSKKDETDERETAEKI